MRVSIKKATAMALCSFLMAMMIGAAVPVFARADGLNELYEKEESEMVVNEEYGSATCDHACLIISGFIGVGGMANAVISLFFLIYGCAQHERVKEKIMIMRMSDERLEALRSKYPPGTRLMMQRMDDPDPIEYGVNGKVVFVDDMGVVHVDWENGRKLGIIPGLDKFRKLGPHEKDSGKER